jgi:hypothetical protein
MSSSQLTLSEQISKSLGSNGPGEKEKYIKALKANNEAVIYLLNNLKDPIQLIKGLPISTFLNYNMNNSLTIIAAAEEKKGNITIKKYTLPTDTEGRKYLSGAINQVLQAISIVNKGVLTQELGKNAIPEYNTWLAAQAQTVSKFGSSMDSMNWYMIILVVLILLAAYYYFNKKSTPKFTIPQQIAQFGRTIRSIRRI